MLDVIKNRVIYLGTAGALIIFSLVMLLFVKWNLGIEMTGGTQSEYVYVTGSINFEKVKLEIETRKNDFNAENNNIINGLNIYTVNGENRIVLETGFDHINDEKTLESYKTNFNEQVLSILTTENETFSLNKYQNIGQSFGEYIKRTAFLTLAISMVAISLYLAYAFYGVAVGISALSFGGVTLFTLFFDVIVAAGLYIFAGIFFPEFKVDTYFVTALLTILGYSINDTIVVFDRIRENIKIHVKNKKLGEIINLSINETLARSLFTSLTLFFVLLTIFIFGPMSLNGFMLTLMFGVLSGTYSSIFVAAPILYIINKDKELKVYEKKIIKDEDKIVV